MSAVSSTPDQAQTPYNLVSDTTNKPDSLVVRELVFSAAQGSIYMRQFSDHTFGVQVVKTTGQSSYSVCLDTIREMVKGFFSNTAPKEIDRIFQEMGFQYRLSL